MYHSYARQLTIAAPRWIDFIEPWYEHNGDGWCCGDDEAAPPYWRAKCLLLNVGMQVAQAKRQLQASCMLCLTSSSVVPGPICLLGRCVVYQKKNNLQAYICNLQDWSSRIWSTYAWQHGSIIVKTNNMQRSACEHHYPWFVEHIK